MRAAGTLAALGLVAQGCGAGDAALPGTDGGVACDVSIRFEPDEIVAGPGVRVRANGDVIGATGFVDASWDVRFDGSSLPLTPIGDQGRDVEFEASEAGVYEAELSVAGCGLAQASFTATAPGALDVPYRLQVLPPAGASLVPQEGIYVVRGGGDADLGVITAEAGQVVAGDLTGAAPTLAAHLRLAPVATPGLWTEVSADALGQFQARLATVPHAVLVVPSSPLLAPRRVDGWQPFAAAPIVLDAGDALAGVVRAPDGQPLVGARVALSTAGVPSTAAITDGAGAFVVRGREPASGETLAISVVPATGSPWPRLDAVLTSAPAGAAIEVEYSSALTAADPIGRSVVRNGSPVALAAAMLVATHAGAGTVHRGATTAPALGTTRRAVVLDGNGAFPSTPTIAAVHDVVVMLAAGGAVAAPVDLALAPSSVVLPPASRLTLRLTDAAGAPLPGARAIATPVGAAALASLGGREAVADPLGEVDLGDLAGTTWDVVLDDPAARGARVELTAVASAALGPHALPPALRVFGRLERAGGAAVAGAVLTLVCASCEGLAAQRPVARVVTSPTGGFVLSVPDPGVAP